MKIQVVCLGNICRSPMAEGILRDMVSGSDVEISIGSAGTNDRHTGDAPDPRAQKAMKKNGHDISDLRAKQFHSDDFRTFDRIYVMDMKNYSDVELLAQNDDQKKKVDLFLNLAHPGENREVPDPYFAKDGESKDRFQEVYDMLEQSAKVLVSQLHESKR